jgi:hypothetical protein
MWKQIDTFFGPFFPLFMGMNGAHVCIIVVVLVYRVQPEYTSIEKHYQLGNGINVFISSEFFFRQKNFSKILGNFVFS